MLLQILIEEQLAGGLLPVGLLHRLIRTTLDNPMQKLAMGQLAAGLQLLDQQLAAFDLRGEPPPPAPSPVKDTPEPTPEAAPDVAATPASKSEDGGELDALRARLAALEERLQD